MKSKLNKLLTDYQKKRDQKKEELKERKTRIYNKIPRLKEIDAQIRKHSIKTNRYILENPENIEKKIEHLQTVIDDLKKEKAYVLTENNIPLNLLLLEYDCDHCKDTGFLKNGQKCKCLKQKLIQEYYKMSNLEHKLNTENFSTFDISVFSKQPIKGKKLNQRQNMKNILSVTEGFVHNFDNPQNNNLLFFGAPGLGKTFLCNCIAKALIEKGYLVLYQTAFKLIEIIENVKFNRNIFASEDENYQMLFNADLLIIDDLGTEMINSFTNAEIFTIINTRLNQNKNTIISTNLSPQQIRKAYSRRISSRILGHYTLLNFYGPDLRLSHAK